MGNGVNLGNRNNVSIADMCGHKVLGMSGSLTNYIMTGDTTPVDSFRRTNKKTVRKNKINLSNILKIAVAALAFASGCALIFKGKVKPENLKKFFSGSFDSFTKSFKDFKTKFNFKMPKVEFKKPKIKKAQKKLFMDEIAILPFRKSKHAVKPDEMSDVIKTRALKTNKVVQNEATKPKIKYEPQKDIWGRNVLVDLIKKKVKSASKAGVIKEASVEPTKKMLINADAPLLLEAPKGHVDEIVIPKNKRQPKVRKVQPKTPDVIELEAPKQPLMLEAPKIDSNDAVDKKVKRQPRTPKQPLKTPDVIELEAPKMSVDEIIKEVKSWGSVEETPKEYFDVMQWEKGQKFRIYDPVSKQKLGYRYVIDENLNPQPIIPKETKASKKAPVKTTVDGARKFYVSIDEPTREQDNIAIDNIAKLTGLDLDDIKYEFGELRPENINVEDIIAEFGS